jgi:uncharacterized protein (DUF58 family)
MKLSREGKRFFLAALLIGIAAFNTGNNLIYLILSMMLSILLLSVLLLRLNVKSLVLRVAQNQPIFVNSPSSVDVTLSNRKKLPAYSLRVSLSDRNRGTVHFPEIPGSSEVSDTVPVIYGRRGVYGYVDLFIESSFPFIFFLKRLLCKVDNQIIVYPEIKDIAEVIPDTAVEGYALPAGIRRGEELSMIREFRYGDDWRRIHWKASAKSAKLMVTEYSSEEPRKLTVILDNLMPYDGGTFERAVSLAASVSDRFLKEGFFVRLLTCRKVIPFGSGGEHLFKILDVLALIEGQASWECPLSFGEEPQGLVMLILASEHSRLNSLTAVSDLVIYATNL